MSDLFKKKSGERDYLAGDPGGEASGLDAVPSSCSSLKIPDGKISVKSSSSQKQKSITTEMVQEEPKKANILVVGTFSAGCRIYFQECRKCRTRHKSSHLLFICQVPPCNGTMTAELDKNGGPSLSREGAVPR